MITLKPGFKVLTFFILVGLMMTATAQAQSEMSSSQVPDTLSVTVYVGFTVKRSGKVVDIKLHQDTECEEVDISQLDSVVVAECEAEAIRLVKELGTLSSGKKKLRFVKPIRVRIESEGVLRESGE